MKLKSDSVVHGYTIIKYLGKGTSGTVYMVDKDDKEFAMKILPKTGGGGDLETEKSFAANLNLSSPFLLKYHDFLEDEDNFYFIIDLCTHGDLDSFLNDQLKENKQISTEIATRIFLQSLIALYHLHANSIIHRDLKPGNMFRDMNDNIKIGDFGCSKQLTVKNSLALTMDGVGTPLYLAPEICQGIPYDESVDIWALGVCMYQVLSLVLPFTGTSPFTVMMNVVNQPVDRIEGSSHPTELLNLVYSMLQKDPKKRPKVRELLSDPYLQPYITKYGYQEYVSAEAPRIVLTRAGKEEGKRKNSSMKEFIHPQITRLFKASNVQKSTVRANATAFAFVTDVSKKYLDSVIPTETMEEVFAVVKQFVPESHMVAIDKMSFAHLLRVQSEAEAGGETEPALPAKESATTPSSTFPSPSLFSTFSTSSLLSPSSSSLLSPSSPSLLPSSSPSLFSSASTASSFSGRASHAFTGALTDASIFTVLSTTEEKGDSYAGTATAVLTFLNGTVYEHHDAFSDDDPFVKVKIGGVVKKTKVIKCSMNPVWDETLTFPNVTSREAQVAQITLWDEDPLPKSNDFIGAARLLSLLPYRGNKCRISLPFYDKRGVEQAKVEVELLLE